MKPTIVLLCLGTYGDVLPLVMLGREWKRRGHPITMMAAPVFAEFAQDAQFSFIPVPTPDLQHNWLSDLFMLGSIHLFASYYRQYFGPCNQCIYNHLRAICNTAQILVISSDAGMMFADLLAHAYLGVPLIRIELEPPPPWDSREPGHILPNQMRRLVNITLNSVAKSLMKELELPELRGWAIDWIEQTRANIFNLGLWPAWFSEGAQGPYTTELTGFVVDAVASVEERQQQLLRRLSSPPDNVVFVAGTLGTLGEWTNRFFAVSAACCRALGCHGVLLGGETGPEAGLLSGAVSWWKYRKLSELLPTAGLIVHHGGIGTAALALAYGVPQLVIPRVFCQPGNAAWLRRLKVSETLDPEEYKVERVQGMIDCLRRSRDLRNRCASVASRMSLEEWIQASCDAIASKVSAP